MAAELVKIFKTFYLLQEENQLTISVCHAPMTLNTPVSPQEWRNISKFATPSLP